MNLPSANRRYTSIADVEAGREAIDETFDRLAWGVLVVDAGARIVRANRLARQLLERRDGLRVGAGETLAAIRADEDLVLKRRIGDATRDLVEAPAPIGAVEPRRAGGGTVAVTRALGARPLTITVVRAQPGLALVFVVDPRIQTAASCAFARSAFGLTAAEARIACRLADGRSAWEIAEEAGLSIATVRTHIKRVLSKTGARRQAELVRLLVLARPPLAPAGEGAPESEGG